MTTAASPTALLTAMGDEAFTRFVSDHLGTDDNSEAVWASLTGPAVIQRTETVLASMVSDMSGQFALRNQMLRDLKDECRERGDAGKADYRVAKREDGEWRRRALGFRLLVDRRRRAVTQQIMTLGLHGEASMTNRKGLRHRRNLDALYELARAVAEHKRAVSDPDGDEPEDEDLWDLLDSITVVTGHGEVPLGEWVSLAEAAREQVAA